MANTENNPVVEAINAAIKLIEDPQIFDVKAPFKASALSPDGRYRQINLKDEEFFLKGVRTGKRSEYIIELRPVSAAGYTQVEILDKDLPSVMPDLEQALVQMLGMKDLRFKTAAKRFLANVKVEEEKAQQKEETARYGGNPNWGSF